VAAEGSWVVVPSSSIWAEPRPREFAARVFSRSISEAAIEVLVPFWSVMIALSPSMTSSSRAITWEPSVRTTT